MTIKMSHSIRVLLSLWILLALVACRPAAPTATAEPGEATPTAVLDEAYPEPSLSATATEEGAYPGVESVYPAAEATVTPTEKAYPGAAAATAEREVPVTADGRRSNIGPYLLSSPEDGQPTHELLADGQMAAYMAVNPAHWAPADMLPDMEGYGRNWISADEELGYIRAGKEGAQTYFERFKDTYRATEGQIHAWMSTWAFEFGDEAFAAQWVEFQQEWLRLMHEHDYLAGVGGMKTYAFGPGEITWLAPAIADADYLFLSESGAPTLMGSAGEYTFLYRDLVAELQGTLGEDGVPELILDVCVDGQALDDTDAPGGPWWQRGYIQFETPKADYEQDVRAYDLETLEDPYVRHVFWFATNITDDTHSFDVDTDMLRVADGWHDGETRSTSE